MRYGIISFPLNNRIRFNFKFFCKAIWFKASKAKPLEIDPSPITAIVYEYEIKVDEAICKQQCGEFFKTRKNPRELEIGNPNRPLFSEETTRKVIGELVEKTKN